MAGKQGASTAGAGRGGDNPAQARPRADGQSADAERTHPDRTLPERTCIVTRASGETEGLIRFVAGPDGTLVPDIKGNLPGRGCWVTATRDHVTEAVKRKAFARALKTELVVPDDLPDLVDRLLTRQVLGNLGLLRKAGHLVLGAAKVEAAVRSGKALFVLHATDGAEDGVRKVTQARKAVVFEDGPDIPAFILFPSAELDLALGAENVIHAAAMRNNQAVAVLKRTAALARFRQKVALEKPAGRVQKAPGAATKPKAAGLQQAANGKKTERE